MAAMVLRYPVVLVFLLVFPVFCLSNMISFAREELLNIRQNTLQNLLPVFDYLDVLLDIVVGAREAQTARISNTVASHPSGESPLSTQQNG